MMVSVQSTLVDTAVKRFGSLYTYNEGESNHIKGMITVALTPFNDSKVIQPRTLSLHNQLPQKPFYHD